jgi:tetratricopeptide (TPR) repeat protein
LVFWIALLSALGLTALAYAPGLHGVFLFDDFANLAALGDYGSVDRWSTFWRYITSGLADPTGRPLALLSFLLDAHDWPADPYPFKRTNLILHLLNGLLLALLLRRLGRAVYGVSRRIDLAAALGAALWALHPLFVSTTLYIVQRQAMLAATFTLLGLLGWCRGRQAAASGRTWGPWLAGCAIVACTILGLASKANGILLPLLAGLVDAWLLASALPITDPVLSRRFDAIRRGILALPSLLLLAWLAWRAGYYAWHGMPSFRPWTLGERLLSEARAVVDYLIALGLPRPYPTGLFNDAFPVSTGLLSPPTTLVAIVALATLLLGVVALRKRAPTLALAIGFYFAGHLLESTVLPLELYYEHRNYLPAMLLFWPLALWLTDDGPAAWPRRILAVGLPLLCAAMTYLGADLWGNVRDQAELWAAKNPLSPRAQAYAAKVERERGNPARAIARLRAVPAPADQDLQVVLNRIGAECELGRAEPADVLRAEVALRQARLLGPLVYLWLSEAIGDLENGSPCPGLDADAIEALIDACAANAYAPDRPRHQQEVFSLRGGLALARHDADAALAYFNRALDARPDPAVGLHQAALLGAAGHPAQALAELDHLTTVWRPDAEPMQWSMAGVHAWLLRHQGYWEAEIAHLRETLRRDLAGQPAAAETPRHE